MLYLFIIVLLFVFSLRYDINGKEKYRNECYISILIIFILVAGFRYRLGIDTTRYLYKFYHTVPVLSDLSADDFSFGSDPLWILLNSLVLTLGGRFYIVQLIQAAFVNILLFKYVKKHTEYIFTCVFLYFIYQYFAFNMEELRASMALVVCLYANDYIMEKKWLKGMILYAVGGMFHISAIMTMIMPLFFVLRFNKIGISCLVLFLIGTFISRAYVEDYLYLFEFSQIVNRKAMGYVTDDESMTSAMNVIGVISQITIYLYAIISIYIIKYKSTNKRLLKFEPLLLIFLMWGLTSIYIDIVYRFARFYVVYYFIYVSYLVVYLFRMKSENLSKGIVFMKAFVCLFPLLFLIFKQQLTDNTRERYLPYSSILEKNVDREREKVISKFSEFGANLDEY